MLDLVAQARKDLSDLVETLCAALGVDSAMVSCVNDEAHHVVAAAGTRLLPEVDGRVHLDYSICVHAAEMGVPLIVEDVHSHPLLRDGRMVRECGVAAYLGVPLRSAGPLPAGGTVCAMHRRPRRWTGAEIARAVDTGRTIDRLLAKWRRPP